MHSLPSVVSFLHLETFRYMQFSFHWMKYRFTLVKVWSSLLNSIFFLKLILICISSCEVLPWVWIPCGAAVARYWPQPNKKSKNLFFKIGLILPPLDLKLNLYCARCLFRLEYAIHAFSPNKNFEVCKHVQVGGFFCVYTPAYRLLLNLACP